MACSVGQEEHVNKVQEVQLHERVHPVDLQVAREWNSQAGNVELKDDQKTAADKEALVFEDLAHTAYHT